MTEHDSSPYFLSQQGVLSEEEYNAIQNRYLDRSERLEAQFADEVTRKARQFLSDYAEEWCAFYGDGDTGGAESALAARLVEVINRTVDSETWLEFIAESAATVRRDSLIKPDGFIYVLEAGPYYKIGRTSSLPARLKTLKIQLPFSVQVVAAFPCEDTALAERELHRVFDKYRSNGEWFVLPDGGPQAYGVKWLQRLRYATTCRREWASVAPVDFHESLPIAVSNSSVWHAAFEQARMAVEAEA